MRLPWAVQAWGTAAFDAVLKAELEQAGSRHLPLQQGLTAGSLALDDDLKVMILTASGDDDVIRVKAGLFYQGVVDGCGCADDPTPLEPHTEYCEVWIRIDRHSGAAVATLADD